ncbi:DUF1566 domain-containing protein [Sulfurimonas marina]|uniref:DUF1566 domain-containing protein n=1 Tax=Sulfurimonas marina TaxID=2590551 RepID=A0A7M1AUT3_9BACT|nr:DUF1566 domain-containing protein [Sulfurimonas marina]QOP41193.1 DUF1566 domain-containing protein [Sulfurimonas marina]
MLKKFAAVFLLFSAIAMSAQESYVVDKKHDLMWQDSDEKVIDIWKMARSHCSQLTLGGYDNWRLPTKWELVELSKDNELKQTFKHMKHNVFWSSDDDPKDHYNAITVYSGNGFISNSDKCEEYATICVRTNR